MKTDKLLLTSSIVILLVGCVQGAAVMDPGPSIEELLPLNESLYWDYSSNIGNGTRLMITNTYNVGNRTVYVLTEYEYFDLLGEYVPLKSQDYYVNDNKLIMRRYDFLYEFFVNPGMIKFDASNLTPGYSWTWNGLVNVYEATLNGTYLGLENVSITLGEFEAYKFETVYTFNMDNKTSTTKEVSWLVPGIGMVKSEAEMELLNTTIKISLELIDYGINPLSDNGMEVKL